MREAGLIQKWNNDFIADVHQCLGKKKNQIESELQALTLKDFTSAFAVLIIGFIMAIIALLCGIVNK